MRFSSLTIYRAQSTLRTVDLFAKDLHDSLATRNLTDIVDIIFVSDHGMTETVNGRSIDMIYLDDILGEEYKNIEHEDGQHHILSIREKRSNFDLYILGWPSVGLRFRPTTNVTRNLEVLLRAVDKNPEKFDVFTHETMPKRYHFSNNERIAPIYVIPKIGYALTNHKDGDDGMSKGVSVLIICLHIRMLRHLAEPWV